MCPPASLSRKGMLRLQVSAIHQARQCNDIFFVNTPLHRALYAARGFLFT